MIGAALLLALLQGASPQRAAAPAAAPPAAPDAGRLRMGVRVTPDTVTVGQHFLVTVRVRVPRGAQIGFPVGPDSGLSVEAVDPRAVARAADSTAVDETATYRLVAWDTGGMTTHLGDVVVSLDGTDRRFPVTGDSLYVRSVLPRDTALQVPKPARDILVAGRPWWHWLLLALAALALLGLLIWWWRRRRRARAAEPVNPYEEAMRAFRRIESLDLIEAGERGRYVALHVEALRDYLAARIPTAHLSLTATELLEAMRARAEVPAARLAPVLAETDLIKFARRPVTAERARELGAEARGIVDDVERAIEAERARAEAARAERAA
ncbi:MAG TPA: hypothetical protein VF041_18175 [Gemmatimonadaceae bacterium]